MTFRLPLNSLAIVTLAAFISGCVLSIEPVIRESDALFDESLIGTWRSSPNEYAVVSRADGSTYTIVYTSHRNVGRLKARMGRLADRTVLDIWPAPFEGDVQQPYAGLLIDGHFLMALDVEQDQIRTTILGADSLVAAFESGAAQVPYRMKDTQMVLEGGTEELQKALLPILSRPGLLSEPTVWRREDEADSSGFVASGDPCFSAAAWPEADRIFHRDPHWVGADVASSTDLGDGRILWLFGDTWIDPSGTNSRRGSRLVSNSLAIQKGTDPTDAAMSFYWGESVEGRPEAFFPDAHGESLWPGTAVRVGDRLVVFFARTIRNVPNGLGFDHPGWAAIIVENPDAEPSDWRITSPATPENPLGILLGFAATQRIGDFVYAFGSQNPVKSHPVYVARWRAEEVQNGDLMRPEWWAGRRIGWVPDSTSTARWPLFENGASELSIHQDSETDRFIAIQTVGFGPAELMIRFAPGLTGPWSSPQFLYRPFEYSRPNVMIYAGRAHPELTGGDLIVTYATNTFEFSEQMSDSLTYYPHFARLTRCNSSPD